MPQPSLLDLISSLLTNAIVIHDGQLMAVCPTDAATEDRLRQLCIDGTDGLLPPGLALITSAPRAADTLKLLAAAGISMDIRVSDPAVAVELRDAVIAGVKERGGDSSDVVDLSSFAPQRDRRRATVGVDPSRN